MPTNYVCTLDERSQKVALEELEENPKERESQVETFRAWVKQQPHLICPTDAAFLLKFLRLAHFSQLAAREQLDRYLTTMSKNRDLIGNIDVNKLVPLLKTGMGVFFPGRDVNYRKVLYCNEGRIDPKSKSYKSSDVPKLFVAMIHYFLYDENNQVNGMNGFIDGTGVTLKHASYINIETRSQMSKILTGIFPLRIKTFNLYNLGDVMQGIVNIVIKFMPQKLQDRVQTHSSLEKIYSQIGMENMSAELLPDDYEGSKPLTHAEITDKFIKEITKPEVRQYILDMTSTKFGVDEKKRPASQEPQASFRKLNID